MKRTKGLYLNSSPQDQPEGTYRHALNLRIDTSGQRLVSEEGNQKVTDLPAGAEVVGRLNLDADRILLFIRTASAGKLGIISSAGYTEVFSMNDLVFPSGGHIAASYRKDFSGKDVVYWTDGVSSLKALVLDDASAITSLDQLDLFGTISAIPTSVLTTLISGGALPAGTYYPAIAVKTHGMWSSYFWTGSGTPISREILSYFSLSLISGQDMPALRPGENTGAGLRIQASVPAEVTDVRVALVSSSDGVLVCHGYFQQAVSGTVDVSLRSIDGLEDLTLEDILVDKVSYKTAKTMHSQGGVLYLGGVTTQEDIGYQRYANAIQVKLETASEVFYPTYHGKGFSQEVFLPVPTKGFGRNQVYAFYISWVLKNGRRTKAYHIPGRPTSLAGEASEVTVGDMTDKSFRFNGIPDSTGMGYWENDSEVYPDTGDFEVWNVSAGVGVPSGQSLRNQKVRHHRFPDHSYQAKFYHGADGTARQNTKQFFGVRFTNIQIPDDLADQVIGWKIHYAVPTQADRLVLDVGMLTLAREFATTPGGIVAAQTPSNPSLNALSTSLTRYVPSSGLLGILPYNFHGPNTMFNKGLPAQGPHFLHFIERASFAVGKIDTDQTIPVARNGQAPQRTPLAPRQISDAVWAESNQTDGTAYDASREESRMILNLPGEATELFGFVKTAQSPSTNLLAVKMDYGALAALCVYRKDVYLGFDRQTLADMGKLVPVGTSDSGALFEGDHFIGRFSYKYNSGTAESVINANTAVVFTTPVETYAPVNMRVAEAGQNGRSFWPAVTQSVLFQEESLLTFKDNYVEFPYDYSRFGVLGNNSVFRFSDSGGLLDTAVARSRQENLDLESEEDPFRIFLANDIKVFPRDRGALVHIDSWRDQLLIHFERSLVLTRGREELSVADFRAFVGAGDIFSTPETQLFATPVGFAGLQDAKALVNCELGYVFIDQNSRKVFAFDGKIQEMGAGLSDRIRDLLQIALPNSLRVGYDSHHSRFMFKFGNHVYSHQDGTWASEHSWVPDFWVNNRRELYSIKDGSIWEEGVGLPLWFGNVPRNFEFAFVDNREPSKLKSLESVQASFRVRTMGNQVITLRAFDEIKVTNSFQDTGWVPVVVGRSYSGGNAVFTQGYWQISGLRHQESSLTLSSDLAWSLKKRLVDRYHEIWLRFIPDEQSERFAEIDFFTTSMRVLER